jgi:hypothetical protein
MMLTMMIVVGLAMMLVGPVVFLLLLPEPAGASSDAAPRPGTPALAVPRTSFFVTDETVAAMGPPEAPRLRPLAHETTASVSDAVTVRLVKVVLEQHVRAEQAAVESFLTRPSLENLQLHTATPMLS